jgi:hypothetical protein
MYRHRGHRYISVRELDNAIADLEKATQLVAGKPDEVEPDGQPNAANRPIGTLHSNIAYHLALAYYLKGEFARRFRLRARTGGREERRSQGVDGPLVVRMSLRRQGRMPRQKMLAQFRKNMDVIENQTYHRLMLLYKGELPVDSVLPEARQARCP